jgi:hypothetical protein
MAQKKLKVLKRRWTIKGVPYINFVDGIDVEKIEKLIDHGFNQEEPWETAVVIDDCLVDSKNPYLQHLFVAGRQRRATIFELLQSIFPPGSRTHRLNTGYFVLFKFASQDEARRLFQQVTCNKADSTRLLKTYREIINSGEHRCLILDLVSPTSRDAPLRVRDTDMDRLVPSLWDVH